MKKYLLITVIALIPGALLLAAGLRGCGVFSRLAGSGKPPACVVDIDQTITDGRRPARTLNNTPLLRAREVLTRIGERGIAIFYLSKRPSYKLEKTGRWLKDHGFPPGEMVILNADPKEDGYYYKLREIRKIQERYTVLCGFGNENDRPVYRDAGIKPVWRRRWRDEDWLRVGQDLGKILAGKEEARN